MKRTGALQRKAGLKSKRAGKPRRVRRVTCAMMRCPRPPRFTGYCASHATKIADKLFSLAVRERDRRCVLSDRPGDCTPDGQLYCCHLIPRSYRATRWLMRNAVAGCSGHHRGLDTHPLEKEVWMLVHLGRAEYDALRALALTHDAPDVGEVIEELQRLAA